MAAPTVPEPPLMASGERRRRLHAEQPPACCCYWRTPLMAPRPPELQQQQTAHHCHRLHHQAISTLWGAEASWRRNPGARALWHRSAPGGRRRRGSGSASWPSSSSEPWGPRGWGHPSLLPCKRGIKQPGRGGCSWKAQVCKVRYVVWNVSQMTRPKNVLGLGRQQLASIIWCHTLSFVQVNCFSIWDNSWWW